MYLAWLTGNAKSAEYYIDKLYASLDTIARDYPQFLESAILDISLDHRIPFSALIEDFGKLPPIPYRTQTPQGVSLTAQMPFLHRSNRDYCELADMSALEKLPGAFGMLLKKNYNVVISCVMSGLALEKNMVAEALALAKEALKALEDVDAPECIFSAHMHIAAVLFAMGDGVETLRIVKETKIRLDEIGASYLNQNLAAYNARLLLWDGDKDAALEWLENYFVTEFDRLPLFKVFQHFTTARAHMVLNRTAEAMACVLELERLGQDFRRPLDMAEAGALRAALEWATGRRKEAVTTLETVCAAMQPHGFIRVIANEGAAIMPVLKRIALKIDREGYNGGLKREFVNETLMAAYGVSKAHKGVTANIKKSAKPVKLSKQQKLMIEMLSQGYKNPKIAQITGLALPTVKGHIMLAYQKLGVNNAMDAVLKAREIGAI